MKISLPIALLLMITSPLLGADPFAENVRTTEPLAPADCVREAAPWLRQSRAEARYA